MNHIQGRRHYEPHTGKEAHQAPDARGIGARQKEEVPKLLLAPLALLSVENLPAAQMRHMSRFSSCCASETARVAMWTMSRTWQPI